MTDQEDLKRRIGNVENNMGNHSSRISTLEISVASEQVRSATIANDIADIKGTLQWLVRLIISALIMAAVGFALGGGFLNV